MSFLAKLEAKKKQVSNYCSCWLPMHKWCDVLNEESNYKTENIKHDLTQSLFKQCVHSEQTVML
jgi:hypothetical protein